MIKFLISTLAAAGLMESPDNLVNNKEDSKKEIIDNAFFNYFNYELGYTLAAHRSHSSHSSHGSHQSHSNSGHSSHQSHQSHQSSSQPSTPKISPKGSNPTPPKSILPETPKLKGQSSDFKIITLRVQAVLYAYGYYNGPLDGIIGLNTKIAIMNFQKDYGLAVTGTLSDELLKFLQIK